MVWLHGPFTSDNQGALMSMRYRLSYFTFPLCLLVVVMLSGCASRKVVTAVEDQSFTPGAAPKAPAVEEAKVAPPAPVKPEIPAAATVEPPKAEVPPAKTPAAEDMRIVEQPV